MDTEAYRRVLELVSDYHDYAPSRYEAHHTVDDAVQMLSIIHEGRPCVISALRRTTAEDRGDSNATDEWWTTKRLEEILGENKVSIAVTPNGYADSVQRSDKDGKRYFAMPHTEMMTISEFTSSLTDPNNPEYHYLQSQNGNIYSNLNSNDDFVLDEEETEMEDTELKALRPFVEQEIPVVSEALGSKPTAVNLWIGDKRSVTSLHKDPFENIYTVLSGKKIFTLLSPMEGFLLDSQFYPPATYTRHSSTSPLELVPLEAPTRPVPWTLVDPTDLPIDSPLKPIRVEVNAGESLFLPNGWWHHVEQVEGDEGLCVALNYWYEAKFDPKWHALERFIWRSLGRHDLVDDDSAESDT